SPQPPIRWQSHANDRFRCQPDEHLVEKSRMVSRRSNAAIDIRNCTGIARRRALSGESTKQPGESCSTRPPARGGVGAKPEQAQKMGFASLRPNGNACDLLCC